RRGVPAVPSGQTDAAGVGSAAVPTLVALVTGGRIDEDDVESGQRLAHRPVLELLVRRIADLQSRLGLPEAVADEHAPVALDTVDDLGIERLSRAQGRSEERRVGKEGRSQGSP